MSTARKLTAVPEARGRSSELPWPPPVLSELLLPRTDGGVLTQGAVILVALAAVAIAARRSPDLLWLVAGVAVMLLGLFGLRALH